MAPMRAGRCLAMVLAGAAAGAAGADVITVPGQAPTIQAAIDVAGPGDVTRWAAPGRP